ncbi:MAG: TlyA family RNA methyltransferase, partial [Oscillospiraceae bacterium]
EVINEVFKFTKEIGFFVKGLDFSPIKGPEGNIEYLMFVSKNGENAEIDIDMLVEASHTLD